MIEVVLADRCTGCGDCVTVCPTDVLALGNDGRALVSRQTDCQTCFMCELYCPADALYVAPRCDGPETVSEAQARAGAGQFRRESGWTGDPAFPNEHWRMDEIFARARTLGKQDQPVLAPDPGGLTPADPAPARQSSPTAERN